MKYLINLFLIGILTFAGCQVQTTNTPAPAPTVTTPPPPAPPAPKTACEQAQARLTELCLADALANQYCCVMVSLTKKGKNFAQFCEDKQAQGIFVNPECLASVTTCDDIDFCTRSE